MIQMYHVTKTYPNGVIALNDVNIEIEKGEFAFLIGPSGAGKTTFMRLIFREELPSEGQVIIDGRNIERLKEHKVAYLRRSIGVVFQDFKLLQNKTAYDNIAFALRVMGYSDAIVEKKVMNVLDMMGMANKRNMYPNQLAGGEQQRVCIARAIVNEPAILLTDEPTGNLDPQISWEIMKTLLEINIRGTTVIVATHAEDIVNRMKKRVIAVKQGQIVKDEARGSYSYGTV